MAFEKEMKLIQSVSVLNYDNGAYFTDTSRLDRIAGLLWHSDYRRINAQGLFHLYAKAMLNELPEQLLVVSAHVDCVRNITHCYVENINDAEIMGTFDNALTNAAALQCMIQRDIPDHVVIAFTGDEEHGSAGAAALTQYLRTAGKKFRVIVLDVTDEGWESGSSFTIENNFNINSFGRYLIEAAREMSVPWQFVPSDPMRVPDYVPMSNLILKEAEADESWEYDELDIPCFSLCIPINGAMHSNSGCLARKQSYCDYVQILERLMKLEALAH